MVERKIDRKEGNYDKKSLLFRGCRGYRGYRESRGGGARQIMKRAFIDYGPHQAESDKGPSGINHFCFEAVGSFGCIGAVGVVAGDRRRRAILYGDFTS